MCHGRKVCPCCGKANQISKQASCFIMSCQTAGLLLLTKHACRPGPAREQQRRKCARCRAPHKNACTTSRRSRCALRISRCSQRAGCVSRLRGRTRHAARCVCRSGTGGGKRGLCLWLQHAHLQEKQLDSALSQRASARSASSKRLRRQGRYRARAQVQLANCNFITDNYTHSCCCAPLTDANTGCGHGCFCIVACCGPDPHAAARARQPAARPGGCGAPARMLIGPPPDSAPPAPAPPAHTLSVH